MTWQPENRMSGLGSEPPMVAGNRSLEESRTALVIGHPGHELCVYGWIAQQRPKVFVLTDGSGHTKASRIQHTTAILDRLGATKGSCYGRFADAAIYHALLNHDFNTFAQLAIEIAEAIVKEDLTCIAGDSAEGYNPTHDACRLVVNAAVNMARERYGRNITNLEFVIEGRPNNPARNASRHSTLTLDDRLFEEKFAAARNYPGLNGDAENLVRKYSTQAFRTEYLYRAGVGRAPTATDHRPPYYEAYGEQRVRGGYYEEVIRYHEHLLPLARNLLGRNGASA
jgi:hypothetical protein